MDSLILRIERVIGCTDASSVRNGISCTHLATFSPMLGWRSMLPARDELRRISRRRKSLLVFVQLRASEETNPEHRARFMKNRNYLQSRTQPVCTKNEPPKKQKRPIKHRSHQVHLETQLSVVVGDTQHSAKSFQAQNRSDYFSHKLHCTNRFPLVPVLADDLFSNFVPRFYVEHRGPAGHRTDAGPSSEARDAGQRTCTAWAYDQWGG